MGSSVKRLEQISEQIGPQKNTGRSAQLQKNPDDVVITLALRSPLTKAHKGAFKDTQLEDLLVPVLKVVRERSKLDPSLIEEIVLGNVLHPSPTFTIRTSAIVAGFPASTAASIVSRWCSSGLLAVQSVANQIISGCIDIGIAIGAESMSTNADNGAPNFGMSIMSNSVASDTTKKMGWTSEQVAGKFGISREAQDEFAALSFQRAEKSQKAGWPAVDEIIPISTKWTNPETGQEEFITVDRDDGVRYGTTKESLLKIRPAFPQWKPSTTTGGNASQITDGAAAILLMKRSTAEQLGQPILGKFVASTVIGVEPRIMGIGPTLAIPKLLKKVGLSKNDVDVFEINEAFASMAVYCVEKLGLDLNRVNPRGGAIAFGHPLGCTGARQIVSLLSELRRTNQRIGMTSMCVGTVGSPIFWNRIQEMLIKLKGMGMAGLIVSEH